MGKPNRFVTVTGLATLLLLGCADSERPTEPREPAAPSYDFTNGPSTPGPLIFRLRESDWFVFLFPDFRSNLTASVGIVERFSAFCEGGPVTIPAEELQFLFSPTGRIAVLVKGREMPVVIYAGVTTDFCTDLATAPIIASGTAHFVFNHHDLTSEASNGYRAQGTVELTAGGQAHFSGVVKFVTTPDGSTRVLVSQVNLSALGN
ncbi:MAG: hypothetical protein ABI037_12085 [Gemmatimonadales bacterium]